MPTNVSELRTDVRKRPTSTSAVEVGIAVLCVIALTGALIPLSILLGSAEIDVQGIGPLLGP